MHAPQTNITKEEAKALKELTLDKDRVILTVDKWMPMVVINTGYINKAMDFLTERATYRPLTADPPTKIKKIINMFRTVKAEDD